MKKRILFILLSIVVVIFILIILAEVFGICLFESRGYIDLNSGDQKFESYICSLKIISTTHPTPFSREVHRLGIDLPDGCRLVYMSGTSSILPFLTKIHRSGKYRELYSLLYWFPFYFLENNIPDNDRITICQQALNCMKKENVYDIENALKELQKKLENQGQLK